MKLIESKLVAWVAMALVMALVVIAMLLGTPWWGFIAIFFCFLGIFAHLAALYLCKMSRAASSKLELCALILIVLAVIGFIVEYIVYNFML